MPRGEYRSVSLEYLHSRFYIDGTDATLRWKHDVIGGSWRKAGDKAGEVANNGYYRVGLKLPHETRKTHPNRRMFTVHRLMYQMYHNIDYLPSDIIIDHVNGIKTDNRKENLRVATKSENNCNIKLRKDNTSGYKNISVEGNRFIVSVQFDRVQHTSRHEYLEDAIACRDALLRQLHGDFASRGRYFHA